MDSESFEALFEPLSAEYSDKIRLIDKYVGFSVQRRYPPSSKFTPALNGNGEPDDVALIHVLIDPDLPASVAGVPLRLRVSKFSKYLAGHFDYDAQDPNSPTEESVKLSKAGTQPIDGMIVERFYVDPEAKQLKDASGRSISGKELLDYAFDQHVRTTSPLHPEQLRLRLGEANGYLLSFIAIFARFLLTGPFGRELFPDKEMKYLFYGYRREHVRKLSVDSIKIFEYLLPKPTAILFCLMVVIFFFFFHFGGGNSAYLRSISNNGVLAAAHGVVVLWILNDVIPELLRLLLNFAIAKGGRYRSFRISRLLG